MGQFMDLTNQRFGELRVVRLADFKIKSRPAWVCACDCGIERTARAEDLRSGAAKSCGQHRTQAWRTAAAAGRQKKRKYPPGTDTHSRLYTLWRAMLWRCRDRQHVAFARYGGAGVRVCEEWQGFAGFREWAMQSGYADTLTIDRINNDGDYEPGNCRWATPLEQARNRRQALRAIEAFGERKSIADWARDPRCAVSYDRLLRRLDSGQPAEFAITATERQARCKAAAMREEHKAKTKQDVKECRAPAR